MNHEILDRLLINYVNSYIRVHDCDDELIYKWDVQAMEQAEKAIHDLFDEIHFSPLGDNHHNALACPYCTPKK
jgi:hypothetical protein